MDDIFVIIITLIIAVIGALNRKKKKNAKQAPVSGENKPSSGFWDMIMNDENDEAGPVAEYMEPEVESVDAGPVVQDYRETKVTPSYRFSAANEGKSDIEEETKAVEKKKRHVTIDGENFSLKKAVIYSEIMNRKYL